MKTLSLNSVLFNGLFKYMLLTFFSSPQFKLNYILYNSIHSISDDDGLLETHQMRCSTASHHIDESATF